MTTALFEAKEALKESFAKSPIVIVGNGPVGVKAAQRILDNSDYHHVAIYGDERSTPYNRVQLSLFLSGKVDQQQLSNPISLKKSKRLKEYVGHRITHIDFKRRIVTDQYGSEQRFSKLILATGSSAYIPALEGIKKSNVYTFRSIDDAKKLIDCRKSNHNVFIVGCGALGLETAIAMKTPSNRVMVGVRDKLLSKYLDTEANTILKDRIQSSGVELIFSDPIAKFSGNNYAEYVHFDSGRKERVDSVVLCTGIRPNVSLAKQVGIEVNHGIKVDDYMQTNIEHVYAIGECAEHNGATYGIVAPGFEQAETCVDHILGSYKKYQGSINNLKLKIQQHETSIFGDIESPADKTYTYTDRLKGVFRKVLVTNNRIQGFVCIGEWDDQQQLKFYIQEQKVISKRLLNEFESTGLIWGKAEIIPIRQQPEEYIVCLCRGITRGEISNTMDLGYRTVESLCDKTGAGKTCGSCKPLVAQMLDAPLPNLVMRHHRLIYFSSLFSIILIAVLFLIPPLTPSDSVQSEWNVDFLLFENFWKQVSGYTLLGLCVLAGMLSARKRIQKMTFGNLDNWRLFHSLIGVVALFVLIAHTGFKLGSNLNLALMTVFLLATTTGSLVGVFMSKNHHWTDLKLREHRKWWSRIHYTLLWLLPALLGYHIFAVYYF